MNITFREAELRDRSEIFGLASRLATSFRLQADDFAKAYVELLNDSNVDLIVAEDETRIIGYGLAFHHAAFYANGLISRVEELFVLEEYRNRKIGRRLMERIEAKALGRGSKLVSLATRRASEFYKAIGYEESAVYLKKTLSRT